VKVFDDAGYAVLFSEQPIPVEKLRTAWSRARAARDKFFFFKPHVQVTFDKAGKPMFCNAYADNFSVSVGGSNLSGEFNPKRRQGPRQDVAEERAGLEAQSGFDVPAFDLTLLDVPVPAASAPKAEASTACGRDGTRRRANAARRHRPSATRTCRCPTARRTSSTRSSPARSAAPRRAP
jgi:hypothetical protein